MKKRSGTDKTVLTGCLESNNQYLEVADSKKGRTRVVQLNAVSAVNSPLPPLFFFFEEKKITLVHE